MSLKNPLTPGGIEPATFRFVAQNLNHYDNAVPLVLIPLLNIDNLLEISGFLTKRYLKQGRYLRYIKRKKFRVIKFRISQHTFREVREAFNRRMMYKIKYGN